MADFFHLTDFLQPVSLSDIAGDIVYKNGQYGNVLRIFSEEFPDLSDVDIVIAGSTEIRGCRPGKNRPDLLNKIRREFYQQFCWHKDLKIADIGDVKPGKTLADSYAALRIITREITEAGKKLLIVGGGHDLTLGMYQGITGENHPFVEITSVDALFDLDMEAINRSSNFLMELLTGEPNYVKHYNHIAFQSYYVHPSMLETIDKLRFDCYRVGMVKEDIEEMEPAIRNSSLFSFDIAAIAHPWAPGGAISPNGLNGEEACTLMQYAGMSSQLKVAGIFGYEEREEDRLCITERQISQMIWYFIDGVWKKSCEADISIKEAYNEYYIQFSDMETAFMQNKRSGRWWMQLPDKTMIPCSYKDYIMASRNEIPERWLRTQERNF